MVMTILHKRNPNTGGWYRKTLQYGYDRQQGIDRWMGQKLNGIDPWRSSPGCTADCYADMYACGFLPAHYPLPVCV